jgi:hypothetical protein
MWIHKDSKLKYPRTNQGLFYGEITRNLISWNAFSYSFQILKSSILRDITPRSRLKVNRRYSGTCRLHLQGRRISHASNQHEAVFSRYFMLASCLAYILTLKMGRHFLPKRRLTFNGPHGVISQKIVVLFNFLIIRVIGSDERLRDIFRE